MMIVFTPMHLTRNGRSLHNLLRSPINYLTPPPPPHTHTQNIEQSYTRNCVGNVLHGIVAYMWMVPNCFCDVGIGREQRCIRMSHSIEMNMPLVVSILSMDVYILILRKEKCASLHLPTSLLEGRAI